MYMLWYWPTLHTRGNYPNCQWQGEAKFLRHPPFLDIDSNQLTSSIACLDVKIPIFCILKIACYLLKQLLLTPLINAR